MPAASTQVPAAELLQGDPGPAIRIGLTTTAREIRVSSNESFYLIEKIPEAGKEALAGEFQVRVEREAEESTDIFRVQVASIQNSKAAEELRRRLAEKFSLPVVTRENAATGTTQVRVGEFTRRETAQEYASGPLKEAGYPTSFVVRETVTGAGGGGQVRLALRGPGNLFRVNRTGYMFFPASPTGFLRLDGKPYRGIFDLSLNKAGHMTVVNQLGTEEYLPGVVPAEISPTIYPEFSALAAQAIAARTYALKHMGRFGAEGFDLTADVRTQVYGGMALEKEATNEAVRQTRGLVLYYLGSPISAMYSSTCGGKTEDFSNVFGGPPVPYLTSVLCSVEAGAGSDPLILRGYHDLNQAVFAYDGSPANRNLELARVFGLLRAREMTLDFVAGVPGRQEVREWLEKARILTGRSGNEAPDPPRDITSRAGFVRYAAEILFGGEMNQQISSSDASYYLANLKDGDEVPEAARPPLAFLIQKGLWRPHPDSSSRPSEPIPRCDALFLLARWITASQPTLLRTGVFHSLQDGNIILKWATKTQLVPLAEDPRLFLTVDGRSTPLNILRMIGSERLTFHLDPGGKIDFLEAELSQTGAASDRFSPQAIWETSISRRVVSEKLRDLAGTVGEILDLIPARLGSSGRVIQIQVLGSRASTVLNGYRVRSALGLKDTLFNIVRTSNPDGSIEGFTFKGRGWGHGVGLCQVGAFGMARAGVSYENILKTYYRGVDLRKAY